MALRLHFAPPLAGLLGTEYIINQSLTGRKGKLWVSPAVNRLPGSQEVNKKNQNPAVGVVLVFLGNHILFFQKFKHFFVQQSVPDLAFQPFRVNVLKHLRTGPPLPAHNVLLKNDLQFPVHLFFADR